MDRKLLLGYVKNKRLEIAIVLFFLVSIPVILLTFHRPVRFQSKAGTEPKIFKDLPAGALEAFAKESSTKLLKGEIEAEQIGSEVETRAQAMDALLVKDTRKFLNLAFVGNVKENLPQDVSLDWVESEVEVEGEFENLIIDDFDNKTSRNEYYLKINNSERKRLYFADEGPQDVLTGSKIKVKGIELNNKIAVQSSQEDVNNDGFEVTNKAVIPKSKLPLERKRLAVILYNFQDNPIEPWSPEDIKFWTFNYDKSVSAYYKEASFGKWEIEGDVFGWLTLPFSDTICNPNGTSEYIDNLLKSQGINVSEFDYISYVSAVNLCGSSNWALIGGKRSWFYGTHIFDFGNVSEPNLGIVIHELGHNFGAHHASLYYCVGRNGERVSVEQDSYTDCQIHEYADQFDVMGASSSVRHFNNFHKGEVGWLEPGNTKTITENGIYTEVLFPIEIGTNQTQALRIARIKYPESSYVSQYYYLELRTNFGLFDNFLDLADPPDLDGIFIRLASDYGIDGRSYLVDASPDDKSIWNSVLKQGSTFDDKFRGIKINVKSVNKQRAIVEITKYTPECVRANPSVSIYPLTQWGTPGQSYTYSIIIRNLDSPGCGRSTFNITSSLPIGWTQNNVSIDINPQSSSYTNFTITSDKIAESGYYTFYETVSRLGIYGSVIVSANYNIYFIPTPKPTSTSTPISPSPKPTISPTITSIPTPKPTPIPTPSF